MNYNITRRDSEINFFVPIVKDAEALYINIRNHITSLGFNLSNKRVYTLDCCIFGESVTYTVGEISSRKEMIFAIFESADKENYYVCTEHGGVKGGVPDSVYNHDIDNVLYFRETSSL